MKMIKKWGVLLFFGLMLAACQDQKQTVVEVTQQTTGFGYQISRQEKVLINQPFIPAVQGQQTFKDSLQALKTAQLVVKKIERNVFPQVSLHELDSMKIDYEIL